VSSDTTSQVVYEIWCQCAVRTARNRDVFEDNMVKAKAKAKARGLRGRGQRQVNRHIRSRPCMPMKSYMTSEAL